MEGEAVLRKKALKDDERDKHPFYSDWGIAQHKKRLKELENAEKEEKAKKNKPREEEVKCGDSGVEEASPRKGKQPVRMVRKGAARTKRTSHLKPPPEDYPDLRP